MVPRGLIGLAMRLYRRSPFHPRMGKALAKVLALATRRRAVQPVVQVINGVTLELDLNEVIDASLYYSGTFEANAERAIAGCVKPGMVAVDVGANIGYHTFALARLVAPQGRVIAVEPTSRAFRRLKRNAQLNPFANIVFIQAGLTDRELGVAEVAFQSSYRLDGKCEQTPERVLLTTLDALVREQHLTRVDFVKVDVDGFEGKVFRGAAETLRRFHPHILFELTPAAMKENGDEPRVLLEQLSALGYTFSTEAGKPVTDLALLCAASRSQNLLARPGETMRQE